MRISRIDQLEQYILDKRTASMDELCEAFQISKNTLRRDLEVLTGRGTVEKVYGGVMAAETAPVIPELISFYDRTDKQAASKQQIAALAAGFVRDRDIIFIDSGTTTISLVDHLSHLTAVTVITNSIPVINKAMNLPNINLIALPGNLKRNTASLVGTACVEHLSDYNITRAFMACTGITAEAGICNASTEEYSIKKMALKKSRKHYLLADSSKFGKTSLMTFALLSEFHHLLTDQPPEAGLLEHCLEAGCPIRLTTD